MESAISARGLRKSFKLSAKQRKLERTDARVKTAVDGLSFDVAPGEIYGLLGPNGAGKTTTLRMLAALVKPDEGDALIEGVSVVDDPAGVRSLIGFLTSELKLEDVFSPDYLFDFFSELHHVDAPVRDERKRQLFARFGSDRFALYFSRSMIPFLRSGGEEAPVYLHWGIYAYRKSALDRFVSLPPGRLENCEKLEQLRALENGIRIYVLLSELESIGIDTPEDLIRAEKKLREGR